MHRLLRLCLICLLLTGLGACASLGNHDPLRVDLVGLEPLPGQGLEVRFAVKLRVQNPNDSAVSFNGMALDLDVNGQPLASGVSDQRGTVPRFGESVLEVPVTISAFSAARQALGLAENIGIDAVPYVLRGKLAGGLFGTQRFVEKGTFDLSPVNDSPYRRP